MSDLTRRMTGRRIVLPHLFATPVVVERAAMEGDLYFLLVRTPDGRLEEVPVRAADLERALAEAPPEQAPVVSPRDLFLLVESHRIRYAFAYDPYFAVSLAGVDALPHQLEAVYDRMLPQARLRFLLADDPGAGKTIMAGLLIKELKLRGVLERVLILTPAPLTIQWQDELRSKFDEVFEIITAERARNQLAGNVWERTSQCIASIDFAKQDDVWPDIVRCRWDLVVIDEAHKCSARTFGQKVEKTRRYQLAERLSAQAERILLLTATPHQGDVDQFAHFLRLLDPDQFPDLSLDRQLLQVEGNPWFLRRMKEELRDFDGRNLFTERHAVTVPFRLNEAELYLYNEVTLYINRYLTGGEGTRRHSVALARTVLQRRLASSLRAIRRSLERRLHTFEGRLQQLEGLPPSEQLRLLRQWQGLPPDPEADPEDQDEHVQDQAAAEVTAAETVERLREEVRTLKRLVRLARETEASGEETKLKALRNCLDRAEFDQLKDGRGKLLVFTEHRDTLEYLQENLERWGYSTCVIHGGMDAQARKEVQRQFQGEKQVCIATEAAGEGINLQFCHLMINYDLPWNPNRLEQRMGRIHRIGQQYDVYIFNFCAVNTIEGQIMNKLLEKLDDMRQALGGRVFDVIGLVLKLNDINLEEIIREALVNPRHISSYEDRISRIDPGKLAELEEKTGIALAVSHVNLERVRQRDHRSAERRLMPEYVEQFFLAAAKAVGLRVERRADTLYRVDHVPERLRAPGLASVRRHGSPQPSYRKLTFRKEQTRELQHLDAELLSPGHPLFAAVTEVLEQKLGSALGWAAPFVDPAAPHPYRLHFYVIPILGEDAPHEQEVIHARLAVVLESAESGIELAPPDVLHDLTPADELPPNVPAPPTLEELSRVQRWLVAHVQFPLAEEQRQQREREVEIRRRYLEEAFEASIKAARSRWAKLAARVAAGEEEFTLARNEALKRVEELEHRRAEKLAALGHLRVVRPGPLHYLGTALVVPAMDPEVSDLMRRDEDVERAAMEYVLAYERRRGWEPEDVSRLRDGSGFDIRSLGPADAEGRRPVRRIEVKGRAGRGDVVLTPNEWLQARRHGETYYLYVVWNALGPNPELKIIPNPARNLAGTVQELVQVQGYRVPAQAIDAESNARGG